MKKRIICALCCALMLAGLVGCNNNDSESSQQPQTNETAVTQQSETTATQKIEEEINSEGTTNNDKETSNGEEKTPTSDTEKADALYSEVVNNMRKAKNYHSEQKLDMKISTVTPDGNMDIQTTANISSDYSLGKTDDGKSCSIIHSKCKSKLSMLGVSADIETYEVKDPGNSDNYYAFYEKQSTTVGNTKPKWENKTKDTKSNAYAQLFPDSIKDIKINKKESTSKIIVLEGNADNLLNNSYLQEAGENTKVDTKIKIKIDAVNKVILETEIAAKASTEASEGAKVSSVAKGVQKFSKINKNVTVKVPDAVIKEAKQSNQSQTSDTDSSSKVIDLGN